MSTLLLALVGLLGVAAGGAATYWTGLRRNQHEAKVAEADRIHAGAIELVKLVQAGNPEAEYSTIGLYGGARVALEATENEPDGDLSEKMNYYVDVGREFHQH